MGNAKYQADGDPRTSGPGFAVTEHRDALNLPTRWTAPRVVFVNSMSDMFHARVSTEFIREVFDVMAATPRHTYQVLTKRPRRAVRLSEELVWPTNVWLGVSVETAEQTWRIDELRKTPATTRFVSAEPLLGPLECLNLGGISWLIAGGESGKGHRPLDPGWARSLRDQCAAASVPFFFKQWGGPTPKAGGRSLDGQIYDEMPPVDQQLTLALSAS
jgi:protein gp37